MNSGRRRPGDIAWALSSPFEDAASTQAAHHILKAPKPDELLDLVFPILMDQKTIRFAFNHLERAGADLTKLSFSTKTVLRTAPLVHRRLWPIYKSARWPASDLAHKLTTHRQHLWQATYDLHTTLNKTNFLLLSGRAMEATYPTYHGRLGFDVDLWFPSIPEALEALEALVTTHNFTLKYASIDTGPEKPYLSSAVTRTTDGYETTIGVLSGAYDSFAEILEDTAVDVVHDQVGLKAPTPDDLLLMLATRIQRKNHLKLVNVADAVMILRSDHALTAPRIVELSKKYGSDIALGTLLAHARSRWPSIVPGPLAAVADRIPKVHLDLTQRSVRAPGASIPKRIERWSFETAQIRNDQANDSWGFAATRWVTRELAAQLRTAKGSAVKGPDAHNGDVRIRDGHVPLCGAASEALTMGVDPCVGRRPENRWRRRADDTINEAADRLVSLSGSTHDCRTLLARRAQ